MPQLAWIDRHWHFESSIYLAPALVERLRGTPARLEERVRGVSSELLTRHVGHSWSIQENVGHLLDLEGLLAKRLEELMSGAQVLTAADMENQRTHEANHDRRSIAVLEAGFRSFRCELVARLERLEPKDFARSALHPRLDEPMRLVDLCQFFAEHDDHHLARITELLQADRTSTMGGY